LGGQDVVDTAADGVVVADIEDERREGRAGHFASAGAVDAVVGLGEEEGDLAAEAGGGTGNEDDVIWL